MLRAGASLDLFTENSSSLVRIVFPVVFAPQSVCVEFLYPWDFKESQPFQGVYVGGLQADEAEPDVGIFTSILVGFVNAEVLQPVFERLFPDYSSVGQVGAGRNAGTKLGRCWW